MYVEIPTVPGTPESRIKALQAAKPLLVSTTPLSSSGATAYELMDVATYIETGHSYAELHPVGKRRPKVINVTVLAPPGIDTEEIEHFLSHVKDGSLFEAMEDAVKQEQEQEDAADPRNEPEHQPVDPEDRPRFAPKRNPWAMPEPRDQ